MKKVSKSLMLASLLVFLVSCGGSSSTASQTTSSTTGQVTEIDFWGWGNEQEVKIFKGLVDTFNRENTYNIKVNYVQKPSSSYVTSTEQALAGMRGPDIFYVSDEQFKKWVSLGYLRDISDWVDNSTNPDVQVSKMWPMAVKRYRYNPETQTQNDTDPIWCLPKDIGPSVIYYNKDIFNTVGINIISIPEDECDASQAHGFNAETRTFNNRIAMNWEEEIELYKLLTKRYNPDSPSDYAYYTNWWFAYGWSVGGDCIERDEEENCWKFTLGDTTKHYNEDGVELPSTREAFQHFIDLSVTYEVCPKPAVCTTANVFTQFSSQKIAMFSEVRAAVPTLRETCDFDWDCAPMPKHKDGVAAGHSGSMGFGINKKISDNRALACYHLMEYLAGKEGQAEQAKGGLNLPNQVATCSTDVFLQPTKKPQNSIIFVEAAEYQRGGDWTYLSDKAWIDVWADRLNGDVLNGDLSVDDFFDQYTDLTNEVLKRYK